ncbi:hypothetical protein [Streptomyces roseoverticillatus]|uniref:hypothetical protein n=1 Tax=Streptomyces roseoverticillatus TaxID=66429 RepID=UPI0004BF65F9|nr:hypothetical protein [Streptomyces roseoverticillatus]
MEGTAGLDVPGLDGPQVWRGLAGSFLIHDDQEHALPTGKRDVPLMSRPAARTWSGGISGFATRA